MIQLKKLGYDPRLYLLCPGAWLNSLDAKIQTIANSRDANQPNPREQFSGSMMSQPRLD